MNKENIMTLKEAAMATERPAEDLWMKIHTVINECTLMMENPDVDTYDISNLETIKKMLWELDEMAWELTNAEQKRAERAEWVALTELAVTEFKFKAAQEKAKAVWATPQEWEELEKPE